MQAVAKRDRAWQHHAPNAQHDTHPYARNSNLVGCVTCVCKKLRRGGVQVARRAAKGGAEGATSALRRAGDEMRSPVAAAVTCVRRSSAVCVTRPAPQAPTCTMARTTSADTSWHRVKQICSLESRGVARKANTRRAACRSRATSGRFADILPVERALKCGPRERPLHECSCMHAPQEHGQHERCHTKL